MEAAGEELVPAVDRCLLGLVHQEVLFLEAEPAAVGAGSEGLVSGEDPPFDVGLQPLVLQGPDVAGQLGALPLGGVLEGALVVPVPDLP